MNRRWFLGFILVTVMALAACASKSPQPVTYTIEMTEYAFTPQAIEVQVGQQVTLNLVNKGALEHEIMFGRDVMMTDNRPSGYQTDMFQAAGVEPMVAGGSMPMEEEGHTGFMVFLANTDDTASMTFTVTKDMLGDWEIGCFEQDGVHYDAGMIGTLIVKP